MDHLCILFIIPPLSSECFRPLNIPFEYWIEHVTFGLIYVMFRFTTGLFYRGVPRFANDCPWGVLWYHSHCKRKPQSAMDNAVGCRHNAIKYNSILHSAWQPHGQKIDETLNFQSIALISSRVSTYGEFISSCCGKWPCCVMRKTIWIFECRWNVSGLFMLVFDLKKYFALSVDHHLEPHHKLTNPSEIKYFILLPRFPILFISDIEILQKQENKGTRIYKAYMSSMMTLYKIFIFLICHTPSCKL